MTDELLNTTSCTVCLARCLKGSTKRVFCREECKEHWLAVNYPGNKVCFDVPDVTSRVEEAGASSVTPGVHEQPRLLAAPEDVERARRVALGAGPGFAGINLEKDFALEFARVRAEGYRAGVEKYKMEANKDRSTRSSLVSNTRDLSSFYEAWWFLYAHPKFNHLRNGVPDVLPGFMDNLDVDVVRVDPRTLDYSEAQSAVTRVRLEAGPWSTIPAELFGEDHVPGTYDEVRSHDHSLDCGGTTYEEAIIEMARLVLQHYGDYEEEER